MHNLTEKREVYEKWAERDLNPGHMELSPATPIVLESESTGSEPESFWIQISVNVEKIGGVVSIGLKRVKNA